ncbi:hypothetical protein K493DRAFT_305038 [Basidiobolus meristosporus CBS 931.73]|uniref:Auxin efflux carrier n=1 Tax=Basidiobolus meristosporus CBS 931.73 TaxID=1314790 RepID=A0A1Y1XXU2_9FUNG|nr:hypothetical protein K493DRAFT_305038 [Basidiobolus meristosporus CBS 931.73]|eukprot:ORX90296.1 hypothetical protein K493DRAFT_305038 [Basidiobolus meristosporus CBS 931.73]
MVSVGDSPPFKPGDSSIGVAYMSVLIMLFNLSLFTLGGYKLVEHDYKDAELDEEGRTATLDKMDTDDMAQGYPSCEKMGPPTYSEPSSKRRCSRVTFSDTESSKCISTRQPMIRHSSEPANIPISRKYSNSSILTNPISVPGNLKRTCTTISSFHVISEEEGLDPSVIGHPIRTRTTFSGITDFDKAMPPRSAKLSTRMVDILSVIFSPPNIAVIAGIVIGLIPILKRMWIRETPNSPFEPPLEFLFEVISMIGSAYLPLSLANLGGALAKFSIDAIPLYISLSFVVVKLIITPIIGILTIQFLTYTIHWIPVEDKPLRFLAMFASCVPTATSIMILSQFFSPTGEAKEVATILVFQYLFGMFTMVGALVYILKLLSV